jgi:hypothetical protein
VHFTSKSKSDCFFITRIVSAMNDMLLIIDDHIYYLEVINDIYSKKWLKVMNFMCQSSLEHD